MRCCLLLLSFSFVAGALAPSALADQVVAKAISAGYYGYGGCVSEQFPSYEAFTPTTTGILSAVEVTLDSETSGPVPVTVQIYTQGLGQRLSSATGTVDAYVYRGLYSTYYPTLLARVNFSGGPTLQAGRTYELYVTANAPNDYRCGLFADAAGVANGEQLFQQNSNVYRPGFPYTVYENTQTPPSCPGDSVTSAFNTAATVTPTCSGNGLTYSLGAGASHGTVTGPDGHGPFTYTPTHDFAGADSFTLTATDSQGQTATDAVSVTVAKPPAPSCSGDAAETAFNTSGTATFSCTGTELAYSVGAAPTHGSLETISGNSVVYHPNGGYHGADSFTVTATDPTGQSGTDTVAITVGSPQGVTENASDQLTANTAESGFSLPAGATQTLSLSCPGGEVATDGHPWIQAVDQGTGTPADVQVAEERATAPGTYAFTLVNGLAGQAQGQLQLSCVSTTSSLGDSLALSSAHTQTVALAAGQTAATLTCPDGTTAVAPGYVVGATAGQAAGPVRLVESRPTAGGSGWAFAFDAGQPESVTVSVSCLGYATGHGSLINEVGSSHTVSVDNSGHPSSTALTCPVNTVAALGGYDLPANVAFTGEEPQARTDLVWLEGQGAGGDATLSLLCLGLTTSSTTSPVAPAGVPAPTVQVAQTGRMVTASLRLPNRALVAIRGTARGRTVLTEVRTVGAGTHALALHLNARGRMLLHRAGRLKVELRFVVHSAGHVRALVRTLTLR